MLKRIAFGQINYTNSNNDKATELSIGKISFMGTDRLFRLYKSSSASLVDSSSGSANQRKKTDWHQQFLTSTKE